MLRINCECKSCGHEAVANRFTTGVHSIYDKTECPNCGKMTFSKKMPSFSPKDVKITIVKTKKE